MQLADKKYGVIGIRYREVPCDYCPDNPARVPNGGSPSQATEGAPGEVAVARCMLLQHLQTWQSNVSLKNDVLPGSTGLRVLGHNSIPGMNHATVSCLVSMKPAVVWCCRHPCWKLHRATATLEKGWATSHAHSPCFCTLRSHVCCVE